MNQTANPTPPSTEAEGEGSTIDPMEIVKFVCEAAGRNLWTCFGGALTTLLIGIAIVSAIPRKYESTSKVYASSSGLITSQLTSGRRSPGDDAALKDIYESVYNNANLTALIREAKLVENWPSTRNWIQRFVDRTRIALYGPTSSQDMEVMLIPLVATSIAVKLEDSASIRFYVTWRDPASAQKLTRLAQRNYIATKQLEELSAITRAASVLEDEVSRADAAFAPAVTELRDQIAKLREQAKSKASQTATGPATRAPAAPDVTRTVTPPFELTAKLNELRAEERAILEPWQRRSADLKFQLADSLAVFGPAHPSVVTLEKKLKAASAEPVELLDLRQREADLKASIANWAVTGRSSGFTSGATGRPAADQDMLRELVANTADDPRLAPARIELESVLRKSQEMKGKLDAVRMELAIAQVGFKYRYREIEPARFWPKPVSPKLPGLYTAVAAATLLLGFLAGAARELIRGKIMEEWQVKQLGVNVLARVNVRAWRGDRGERS